MHFFQALSSLLLVGTALAADRTSPQKRAPACATALASPTPAVATCGQNGELQDEDILGSSTEDNQTACRDTCMTKSACGSFSYDAQDKKCIRYKATLAQQGFKASPRSKTAFWSRGCYTVDCSCSGGRSLCGSACYSLHNNPFHCGACDTTCPSETHCSASKCRCNNSALSFCNGSCTNAKSDNNNCGRCGNVCPTGTTCSNGACLCPAQSETFKIELGESQFCGLSKLYPVLDGTVVSNTSPSTVIGDRYGFLYDSYYPTNEGLSPSFDPANSPSFYFAYNAKPLANGACSGSLMLVTNQTADNVAFVDPVDAHEIQNFDPAYTFDANQNDYFIAWNTLSNVPANGEPVLDCFIRPGTQNIVCNRGGLEGGFYTCCEYWRWIPYNATFNISDEGSCGRIIMTKVPDTVTVSSLMLRDAVEGSDK